MSNRHACQSFFFFFTVSLLSIYKTKSIEMMCLYNSNHLLLGMTGSPTNYPYQGRSINASLHGLPVVDVRVETATKQNKTMSESLVPKPFLICVLTKW